MRIVLFLVFFSFLAADTVHVFTVAGYPKQKAEKVLRRLQASCDAHDIELNVLGVDKKYRSNVDKIKYLCYGIMDIGDRDIILFVDAADVLFLSGIDEIVKKFKAFKKPIVFSAERCCTPSRNKPHFAECGSAYKYLNSGGYIGYAKNVRDMLITLFMKTGRLISRDQGFFQDYFLKNEGRFGLDTQCSIFWCTAGVWKSEISFLKAMKRFQVVSTGSVPSIVHFNGTYKGAAILHECFFNRLYGTNSTNFFNE